MITDKSKTPVEIFVQENMADKIYGINQDESIGGMVKYIRSDMVPNDEEMLAFADKESFWLDDRLCPYDRNELRSRAWLEGYKFAKRHNEILVRNVYSRIEFGLDGPISVENFINRFSHNNQVWIENKNNYCMFHRYREDLGNEDGPVMDWELEFTDIAKCNVLKISNVIHPDSGEKCTFTIVVDTDKEWFNYLEDRLDPYNAPLWLREKVRNEKIEAHEACCGS